MVAVAHGEEGSRPASEPESWNQGPLVDLYLDHEPDQFEDPDVEDFSGFFYIFAVGSTLRPRDSASSWDYNGAGCVSLGSGFEWFTLHVDLPEGSRVDFLRLFYYDTSASNNSKAFLTISDGAGRSEHLTSVLSAGDAGYGTTLSPYLGHVVDNSDQGYELIWVANTTGSSMRLCGMRIAYRLPI